MSKNVLISADSVCDLSDELIKKYNIKILPLYVIMNDKSYKDQVELKPDQIYENYNINKTVPKTAAIPPADFEEFFSENLKEYDEIVHFSISSGFSGTYQNSLIAADGNKKIFLVDSKNLSTGIGLLVLKAAEMAQSGKSGREIKKAVEALVPKVDANFVIDTLEYLYKGGRCSALAAFGANLLKLKPCIEVKNGKMDVGKKYRGNIDSVLQTYVSDRLTGADIDGTRVFITHGGISDEIKAQVREKVESFGLFDEILETRAGCTVSSHCGPNTLGVLFIRK